MLKNKNKGFTLIEMLVSILILSFLVGVIYATLSQGLRIWHKAVEDRPEWKLDIFFEKITTELQNVFAYVPPPLVGDSRSLQFYLLGQNSDSGANETKPGLKMPVQLRYIFNPSARQVLVEKRDYAKLLSSDLKADSAPVLDKIKDFKIEYYAYDKKKGVSRWKNLWVENCFPQAVKVSVDFEASNAASVKMMRVIRVPLASNCVES